MRSCRSSNKLNNRGIEPLIAAVIVTTVGIAISVAVSLWMLGVIGSTGYGTRPVELKVFSPVSYGRMFYFTVKNMGGDPLYIDYIYLNNKEVKLKVAYDPSNPDDNLVTYGLSEYVVELQPGESKVLWCLADEVMKAGCDYNLRVHTTLGYEVNTIIKPSLGVDISKLASIRLIALTDGSGGTGKNGWLVEFDPATWEYRFWSLYNPDEDPTTSDDFTLIGYGGSTGNLSNPPPPIYQGECPVTVNPAEYVDDYDVPPTTPIIVALNLHAQRSDWNFTLYNFERDDGVRQVTRFIMELTPKAVAGLDFTILWEDAWSSPSTTRGPGDWRAWIDHVVRVTWLKDGRIRVGVYRCSGGFLHVFYIGDEFIYYKPHGDTWGDMGYGLTDAVSPGLEGRYAFIEGTHFFSFYEIGYDGGNWTSPNGYVVKIWYAQP